MPRSQPFASLGRRASRVLAAGFLAACMLMGANALGATNLEYQVKAAYLYNFLRFVDWPPQAFRGDAPGFNLCLLGREPFGETLSPLSTKTARSRAIRLRHVGLGNELRDCHVLFICQSEASRVTGILAQLRGANVLTVSDLPGFAAHGGVIGFRIDQGKVRLEINLGSARQAGLHVSSKLLEVASEVYRR